MKQFLKDLGVTETRGMTRILNSFDGLTEEEKKSAILSGIEQENTKELTRPKIWLYLNNFLLVKESINQVEKVAVMASNEATEASKEKLTKLANDIVKNNRPKTDIEKGNVGRLNIWKFLIKK